MTSKKRRLLAEFNRVSLHKQEIMRLKRESFNKYSDKETKGE